MKHDAPFAKKQVLDALRRLRHAFPLEQRIASAADDVRAVYRAVLRSWLSSRPAAAAQLPAAELATLLAMDAVVADAHGLGCYPFSARPTEFRLRMGTNSVFAACAFDALAIARLAAQATRIETRCAQCGQPEVIDIHADGGMDHEQAERVRVRWTQSNHSIHHCADGLCRDIRFLCSRCPVNPDTDLRLPQASAVANAFFSFQRRLLAETDQSQPLT